MITLHLFRNCHRMCTQMARAFVERPYTPELWNKMAVLDLKTLPIQDSLDKLMQSIHLMQQEITPFNYDFYQWSCHQLIQHQQDISKEEIMMMLRLGCKYKVRIELFHQHMENELFLRIHRDYDYEIQEEDEKIKQEVAQMLKELQAKSEDYFNLLEDAKESAEEEEGQEYEVDCKEEAKPVPPPSKPIIPQLSQEQKIIQTASKKLIKKSKKNKQISLPDLVEIVQLLRESGSKNLPLLQYIHQLLTIKYEHFPVQTHHMLQYARTLAYICQTLMEEYFTNKQKYTARSIKRIYKYQTLYFHQHFKQLETVKASMNNQEIEQLVSIYAAFPLKRRETRRTIGSVLAEQLKQRNLTGNPTLIKQLMDINKKDEKMRKSYCELLSIEPEQAKLLGYYSVKAQQAVTQKI